MNIEVIKLRFQDRDIRNIVKDIIGTDSLGKIESLITKAVSNYFSEKIEEVLFLEPSAGLVFGLLLMSGEKIVLKIYNRNITRNYLERMNAIQQVFNSEGFPAPKILSPIFELNTINAGIYELIEGKKEDGHDEVIRNELAKYLANFSAIVDKYNFDLLYTFMQESSKNTLWPKPHNVLFDFKKTSRGAGWIAKKAMKAKQILNASYLEKRLAYTDWNVKNTIYKNKKLVGLFDWDSLGSMSEPEMVGNACAQFTADWEFGNKVTPTPEESRQFVKAYERYRGLSFTEKEYHVISASADYLIAMISRFEHAGGDPINHPYQDLLKECGDQSFLFVHV